MSSFKIGIMQGRLTPMNGRGIQFFPFENWKQEFFLANEIGIDEIEFIFDYEDYRNNPLWMDKGVEEIRKVVETTQVGIRAVCFDYFMRRPFFKQKEKNSYLIENKEVLQHVLISMKELGISLIEIPLVDNSSMQSEDEKNQFKRFICEVADEFGDIKFGLETDLPPQAFKSFLQEIDRVNVGANYDSGNSSGLGYNCYEEITILGEYIYNIHIKDRVLGGSTVALGTGSANFAELFRGLKEIGYSGSFILQAARGIEGQESNNIKTQKNFLERYVNNYL